MRIRATEAELLSLISLNDPPILAAILATVRSMLGLMSGDGEELCGPTGHDDEEDEEGSAVPLACIIVIPIDLRNLCVGRIPFSSSLSLLLLLASRSGISRSRISRSGI